MTDYEFEYLQDIVDRYKKADHDYYGYAEIRIDEDECKAIESAISDLSENKGDLISRQAVLYELEKWDWQDLYLPIHFKQILDDVPSIENKGEWKEVVSERFPNGEKRMWHYECSACSTGEPPCPINKEHWDFCPNCGADMRGE